MLLDHNGPFSIPFVAFKTEWLDKTVFQLFKEVALKYPSHLALKDSKNSFTYQQAYQRCLHLANEINNIHPKKEPIGIALSNNAFFPISMMAVLANGCPYVPLDLDLPIARNELIIQHAGVKTIISSTEHTDIQFNVPVINIENINFDSVAEFNDSSSPFDNAYIIYTSGSTGLPKGVYQNQRNLLHDVMQYTNSIHLSQSDRITLLYSPSVNGAIRDIYGSLLNGASLFIKKLTNNGLYDLGEFIENEKITIYHSIPNIFRTFLKINQPAINMSSVRIVYLAGDRIFKSDVTLYKQFFTDNALLYVGIGATEIATIYRQWFISKKTTVHQDLIPLGYSVPERDMRIVSANGKIVPDGEIGEITVTSEFISLGYWNNQEQTSLSFKNDSIDKQIRTFSTGDLGKINSDGMLEFIGRKDNQIKINGHRVEIAEVEGQLMNQPGIDRCAVVVENTDLGVVLVAFFISQHSIESSFLKDSLKTKLPAYMIPRHIIQVEEIPLLHNFKNNQEKIKQLVQLHLLNQINSSIANTNKNANADLLNKIKSNWLKFLDGKSFDQNISWNDAGGDSIAAVHFMIQLETSLNVKFPVDWLSNNLTPLAIYDYLINENFHLSQAEKPKIYFFPPSYGINERTRLFINEISTQFNIVLIAYPNYKSLSPENINLKYLNQFIKDQIPDYNDKNIGYLGNCHGANILNNLMNENKLTDYSLVGILDAVSHLKKIPTQEKMKQLAKSFHIDIIHPSKYFFILYKRYGTFRFFIELLKKIYLPAFKKSVLQGILLSDVNLIDFQKDIKILNFSTQGTIFSNIKQVEKIPGTEMTIVPLIGTHLELFIPENKKTIIDFIKNYFTSSNFL